MVEAQNKEESQVNNMAMGKKYTSKKTHNMKSKKKKTTGRKKMGSKPAKRKRAAY